MRQFQVYLVLFIASISVAWAHETLDTTSITSDDGINDTITLQENRNGWVNPEDLPSMPQCIAQQDQSDWLRSLTQCTHKQCTRHFGIICTHHQWLTELNCLSTTFSEDVIREYISYCSRSVLAKAQLYRWIREITDRTWLVEVGDANGLMELEPSELAEGYAPVYVANKAPACLAASSSKLSSNDGEGYHHVLASCEFTSTTQHTGNAQRAWEYHEDIQSMISLDSETAGYDLIRFPRIEDGTYFDKACFCGNFRLNLEPEPCSDQNREPDLTRERMWIHATCGPALLPANWTVDLRTTESAYIPLEDWTWPSCVEDFPRSMFDLKDQCVATACEPDGNGYCGTTKRSVDRACFCHSISFDSCAGSCHVFESRIEYVKWLHNLCGTVENWKGLPHEWKQLAKPTISDMIPWGWTLKESYDLDLGSDPSAKTCPSLNSWKFGSIVLVNTVTLIAMRYSLLKKKSFLGGRSLPHGWISSGFAIASTHLFANWINAVVVQSTPGYEHVSLLQLTLLWSSLPRVTWLPVYSIGMKSLQEGIEISSAGAALVAETILLCATVIPMFATVSYGVAHNFYGGGLIGAQSGGMVAIMYLGALMWAAVIVLATLKVVRGRARSGEVGAASKAESSEHHRSQLRLTAAEDWSAQADERRPLTDDAATQGWQAGYGTLHVRHELATMPRNSFIGWYDIVTWTLFPLWITQWMFWGGLIGLGSDEYLSPLCTLFVCLLTVSGIVHLNLQCLRLFGS